LKKLTKKRDYIRDVYGLLTILNEEKWMRAN